MIDPQKRADGEEEQVSNTPGDAQKNNVEYHNM